MKVIVVGGGIAGLAAAIGLSRAGHFVKIFERSSFSREIGAAINICPNASRILLQWGFDPMRSRMVTARKSRVTEGHTLKQLVEVDFSNFIHTYGAPFYFAHRVDLHSELRRLVSQQEPLVDIVLKSEVVAYGADEGSVTLSDGSKHDADLVVAADGIHSIAVNQIIGHPSPAVSTGQAIYRFLIPTEDVRDDPTTAPLLEDGVIRIITGTGVRRMIWYSCADGTVQNFAGIHPDRETDDGEDEDWNNTTTVDDVLSQYHDFHPGVLATFKKATTVHRWPLLYREPLPSWSRGRLVLIGDAAHPMLPHQGQGGAQAIEDAGALHEVFVNLPKEASAEEIKTRLDLFQAIRINRASAVQIFSNAGQDEAEKVKARAQQYMPNGSKVPSTPAEYIDHNFRYDVLKDSRFQMQQQSQAA